MAVSKEMEYPMRLHEQGDIFTELIADAAEAIGLPQVYVEVAHAGLMA